MPTSVDKTAQSKDRHSWIRLMHQWFSLSETITATRRQDCCGKEGSEKSLNKIGKTGEVGVSFRHPKITTHLVSTCGQHQDQRHRPGRSNAELDHQAVEVKANLFRRTTADVPTEEQTKTSIPPDRSQRGVKTWKDTPKMSQNWGT